MNIADLKNKHHIVDFSSFDDAKNRESKGLNVRWVRNDSNGFHIRNGTDLFHSTDSIAVLDNVLSNIEFLKNWTEIVSEKLKSIKHLEVTLEKSMNIMEWQIKISICSIGFFAATELNRKFDGSLFVYRDYQKIRNHKEATLNDLNKIIVDCIFDHAKDAKKTYEDSIEMLSSIQRP